MAFSYFTMTGSEPDLVARVAANYSSAADGYAEFWSPVIQPVGRRLLSAVPWARVTRVLDVGTGTGALVPEIVAFAPAASVIGVDPAAGMLRIASTAGARLAVMDAMSLGLATGCVDVAVMAFVLFHVPDPVGALAEIRRVLRPGGALAIATWLDDPVPPAGQLWDAELDRHGALDPNPQPRRDELMNSREKLARLLAEAGFAAARTWTESIEHQWDRARFFGLRTSFGTPHRRLQTLPHDARVALLDRMRERFADLPQDAFLYRATAVCAVAATSRRS